MIYPQFRNIPGLFFFSKILRGVVVWGFFHYHTQKILCITIIWVFPDLSSTCCLPGTWWGHLSVSGMNSRENQYNQRGRTIEKGLLDSLSSLNTLLNVTSGHFALARGGSVVHELVKFALEPRYPPSTNCIPRQGAPQASYWRMRKGFLPFLPDFFLYLPPDGFWLSVAPFLAEKETEINICV